MSSWSLVLPYNIPADKHTAFESGLPLSGSPPPSHSLVPMFFQNCGCLQLCMISGPSGYNNKTLLTFVTSFPIKSINLYPNKFKEQRENETQRKTQVLYMSQKLIIETTINGSNYE